MSQIEWKDDRVEIRPGLTMHLFKVEDFDWSWCITYQEIEISLAWGTEAKSPRSREQAQAECEEWYRRLLLVLDATGELDDQVDDGEESGFEMLALPCREVK